MKQSITDIVADYLGQRHDAILSMARDAPSTYRHYRIPKKNGGTRSIFHPSKRTKMLQYALMDVLLCKLPVHAAATGYRQGLRSPLKKTAERHSGFRYSVRLDMSDFFPSISPADLLLLPQVQELQPTAADEQFLRNCLFLRVFQETWGLAIGAPSSPMISNAIMYGLDTRFFAEARDLHGVYTRYADDLVFSSNARGACRDFLHAVRQVLQATASPSLALNRSKTMFMSRSTKRMIVGLTIGTDGTVTIGRKNKRFIKKLVWDYSNGDLDPGMLAYLQGYLSFIRDVEPTFYSALKKKYGGELVVELTHRLPSILSGRAGISPL